MTPQAATRVLSEIITGQVKFSEDDIYSAMAAAGVPAPALEDIRKASEIAPEDRHRTDVAEVPDWLDIENEVFVPMPLPTQTIEGVEIAAKEVWGPCVVAPEELPDG